MVVGALSVGAILGAFRLGPAWTAWHAESRAAAREASAEILVRRAAVADLPTALDTAEARVARLRSFGPALLAGESDAEAADELEDVVAEAARLSGIVLEAIDASVDTTAAGPLRRVRGQLRGQGDVSGVARFILQLEKGPTLLAVRSLSVRPQSILTPASVMEILDVQVVVETLALVRHDDPGEVQ